MFSAPPVRRRIVGNALRRHRESLGYSLSDIAGLLECDVSKVSRIETGHRGIRGRELRQLLDLYSAGDDEQQALVTLADPRGAHGWYRDYADVLPEPWRDYLTVEAAASAVTGYEAQQVPGLLQTRAYARALAEASPALNDDTARDRAAGAVTARQHALFTGPHRPHVHLVIGQAALHQQVGDPHVMRGQLRHLARFVSRQPKLTIQILPFDSGAHAAAGDGSLAIVHVTRAPELGVVHLGGVGGGVCLEGPDAIDAYTRVFGQVRAFALTPEATRQTLRDLAGD